MRVTQWIALQTPEYGHVVSTNLPYEEAVERVTSLLKEEGFGVLCDIDVAKTMHEKIGKEFRPYRILGACCCRATSSFNRRSAIPSSPRVRVVDRIARRKE